MKFKHPAGFLFVLLLLCATAAVAEPPKKVYVPNPTGDVSDKVGAVIASEISAALMKHGIQAFTYANLAEQLKQEEYKEVLQCKADDRCVDEVVAGFGVATRIFTQATKLGKNSFHLELSLETKGKFKNKVTRSAEGSEASLGRVAAEMSLELVGLKKSDVGFTEGTFGEGGEDWVVGGGAQVIVAFESDPVGAIVRVDGKLVCQDTSKRCSRMLSPGTYRVVMEKEKHVTRDEKVTLDKDQTVSWKLEENFGRVSVTTTPPGLPVEINRQVAGKTPLSGLELAPGRYEIRINDPCFKEAGKRLELQRGERENVKLKPAPRQAALRVAAVDKEGNALRADVYVDGKKVGTAPGVHKVSICAQQVEVKKGGAVWEKALSLGEKQVVELNAVLEVGSPVAVVASAGDMVLIAAGKFMMGCNARVDSECDGDEKPYHEVYLDAYSMDRHEVTVGEYRKCVDAGKCASKHHRTKSAGKYCNWGYSARDSHPMNCVDWYGAKAYCEYAGKRLPTEAEWEKAARGTDGRKFPWGNKAASCSVAVFDSGGNDGCGKDRTWPVCSKESGNSPYGLCDMAGNVYEWVADWYGKDYYDSSARRSPAGPSSGKLRVLRGGPWNYSAWFVRASSRFRYVPVIRHFNFGFRCVVSSE